MMPLSWTKAGEKRKRVARFKPIAEGRGHPRQMGAGGARSAKRVSLSLVVDRSPIIPPQPQTRFGERTPLSKQNVALNPGQQPRRHFLQTSVLGGVGVAIL